MFIFCKELWSLKFYPFKQRNTNKEKKNEKINQVTLEIWAWIIILKSKIKLLIKKENQEDMIVESRG